MVSLALLDDEGNLFGVINVVDALVVLFVVAVVTAGAAFVLQPEPAPEEPDLSSTHVTLDLGSQPNYIASEIGVGDTHDADENSELTITDVYRAPEDGQTRVTVRAELEGMANDDGMTYADAPLRLGRSLDIATNRYQVSGAIRSVGANASLPTDTTDVLLETGLPAVDADEVTVGDQLRIGGQTVATVETINAHATRDPNQHRVLVGLTLATISDGDTTRFGVTPVRRGNTLSLATDEYELDGRIQRVGTLEPPGTPTIRTVTLEISEVREDFAETFHAGMTERADDETIARVTNVDVEPSTLITTGDDGSVNVVDHPINRDVTLTTDLQVREATTGTTFKGRSLQQGSTVVLDLGTTTIEATVVNADA
ncbi:DUF4330 domain-containing protein [Halobacterium salinarum]|uniref:DUF4330 family protein n=3 Tax=Halobacterium salinarum NRC-34001 TaxID=2886895 RepID=A0A510N3W5_HALSA|nr:DUF4330 domain-containing protein [Halobacterium salinarum]MDL0125568.1 DUF4330 domain-containing protein [Halobacterium salinarum]MDL0141605.1 DUF4330 domain-containing protein [Halobacterium salinarum]UEB92129.1 DUF4330 domain-containing protein [Halobacterium salinarum NRC-34001]CAP12964.1 DUF4330 family protein [Halobacterium salinarum R1]DAC77397.1 TPA_inf: DUF4330 family protein [Halobacterium salinarum NRC-1]